MTTEIIILAAQSYNELLIDHEATTQSALLNLKSSHVGELVKILETHDLDGDLEIHLLHRHFELQDGEAIVHKEIIVATEDHCVILDVAKAIKCPAESTMHLSPIMWYASQKGIITPYEYATRSKSSTLRVMDRVPLLKLKSFAKEFSSYVWAAGLQHLVSLKDKSCPSGLEFIAYESRALFRIPSSLVKLENDRGLIPTGWMMMDGVHTNDRFIQTTDTHVTKTRQTTGGTVAVSHTTVTASGPDSFNPDEVSPIYTDKMWSAVKEGSFETWCDVAA